MDAGDRVTRIRGWRRSTTRSSWIPVTTAGPHTCTSAGSARRPECKPYWTCAAAPASWLPSSSRAATGSSGWTPPRRCLPAPKTLGPKVVLVQRTPPGPRGRRRLRRGDFHLRRAELPHPGRAAHNSGRHRPVLRSGGWLVFDLHTDTMMDFTVGQPDRSRRFARSSVRHRQRVDLRARTCDHDDRRHPDERWRQIHRAPQPVLLHRRAVRAALSDAGFASVAVTDEYSDDPVDGSTLRATWVARRAMTPVG